MFFKTKSKIVEIIKFNEHFYNFILNAGEIAKHSNPGQFLHIKVSEAEYPILRRPMSILNSDGKSRIEIFFRVVGLGTEILSKKRVGEEVDIMGPLGNPFQITNKKRHILIAGGIGIAPLYFLLRKLKKHKKEIIVFYGGRNSQEIPLAEKLKSEKVQLFLTTEDGSVGAKGMVTDEIGRFFEKQKNSDFSIYVCGPEGMIKTISEMKNLKNADIQVSIESRMACGMGACQGCVVKRKNDGYVRVCKEGPIFYLNEIVI